jgi:hypothetical protein
MGTIADLRSAVVLRLQALPALQGVAILAEDRLDLTSEVNAALATGKGLAVTVACGNEKFRQGANPRPVSEVELIVEVGEIPLINRAPSGSRLPASNAAALIVSALHHYPWEPGKVLVASEKVYDKDSKTKVVVYASIFTTLIEYPAPVTP